MKAIFPWLQHNLNPEGPTCPVCGSKVELEPARETMTSRLGAARPSEEIVPLQRLGRLLPSGKYVRVAWLENQLKRVDDLLTEAGVPETVECDGVPGNTASARLWWFIARRKDVQNWEKPEQPTGAHEPPDEARPN